MAVTTISSRTSKDFIASLAKDYPQFIFKAGPQDHWSPKTNTISYNSAETLAQQQYGVLHELAHGLLGHLSYHSDFQLLKLEAEAWDLASKIGKKYNVRINQDHIQNCLDTYRDWLHKRSTCPVCGMHVLQKDASNYACFNCKSSWTVTSKRFVRPYRRRAAT